MEFQFKIQNPDKEKRKEQCKSLLIKEPDKVPIILEKDPLCHLEGIKKTRHLIKRDFTINKFLQIIKKINEITTRRSFIFSS